jgi:hypothetical protein
VLLPLLSFLAPELRPDQTRHRDILHWLAESGDLETPDTVLHSQKRAHDALAEEDTSAGELHVRADSQMPPTRALAGSARLLSLYRHMPGLAVPHHTPTGDTGPPPSIRPDTLPVRSDELGRETQWHGYSHALQPPPDPVFAQPGPAHEHAYYGGGGAYASAHEQQKEPYAYEQQGLCAREQQDGYTRTQQGPYSHEQPGFDAQMHGALAAYPQGMGGASLYSQRLDPPSAQSMSSVQKHPPATGDAPHVSHGLLYIPSVDVDIGALFGFGAPSGPPRALSEFDTPSPPVTGPSVPSRLPLFGAPAPSFGGPPPYVATWSILFFSVAHVADTLLSRMSEWDWFMSQAYGISTGPKR